MNKNYTELTVCAIDAANALCAFAKKYSKIEDLEAMKQAATEALSVKERMPNNRMIDKCLQSYITTATENDTDLPTTVYETCKELVLFAKKWDTPPATDEAWENCINEANAIYKRFKEMYMSSYKKRNFAHAALSCYMNLLESAEDDERYDLS